MIHRVGILCLVIFLILGAACSRGEPSLNPLPSNTSPPATKVPSVAAQTSPTSEPTPSATVSSASPPPTPSATPPVAASVTWTETYRVHGSEVVHDLLMAEDGGFYLVGTKNLVFEPEQNGDIYLIRSDSSGKKLWEKTFGGDGFDEGITILPTNDGQLMIVGYTNSFSAGGMDVYLIKVDHDGNELWSKTFGGPLDEMGGGGQMPDGSIIVSGSMVDPDDIVADPGAAGYGGYAGRSNVFIARADGEGNPLWTQTFGDEQNVLAASYLSTPDGGFVILANIIAYPEPGNHIYLLKVDENGQQVWSRTWEEDNASGYSLLQTSDGGYLITGPYLVEGSEKEDFLFIKTDADGNEAWRSTFGDPEMIDYGVVLTEAADGGYVAAGEWVKDYYTGDSDLLLVKIDTQGQLVWQQKIETNAHNMVAKILPHPDGSYVIATSIVSGRDFDIMLTRIGEPASSLTNNPIPGVITAETASQIERLALLSGHTDRVTTLAFSRDGNYLASASWDRTIKVWDPWNGQEVYTFQVPRVDLNAIAFSPAENWLAAAETIWDVESGLAIRTFERDSQEPGKAAFSPDGLTLAIVYIDQPIKLWDVASGELLRTFEHPADSLVFGIEFSADGALLAAAEPYGKVRLWDVASGQVTGTLDYGNDSDVHDVAFSPDGRYLASAGTDSTVRLWDLASLQLLQKFWHGNGLYGVTFSPDSSLVASAVCDRTVRLWEVSSGELLRTLPHQDELFTVAFSPDGRLLASAGYDDLIYLWGITR